jgi:hypothetical protein
MKRSAAITQRPLKPRWDARAGAAAMRAQSDDRYRSQGARYSAGAFAGALALIDLLPASPTLSEDLASMRRIDELHLERLLRGQPHDA